MRSREEHPVFVLRGLGMVVDRGYDTPRDRLNQKAAPYLLAALSTRAAIRKILWGMKGDRKIPDAIRRAAAFGAYPNALQVAAMMMTDLFDVRITHKERLRMQKSLYSEKSRFRASKRLRPVDLEHARVMAQIRSFRMHYPYGDTIIGHISTVLSRGQDATKSDLLAALEVARRMLLVHKGHTEVGRLFTPAVDAHMAVRLALMKRRGEFIELSGVVAEHPHLSFSEARSAALALKHTFPDNITYNTDNSTIMVTPDLPDEFALTPVVGVSPLPIEPTTVPELDALLARITEKQALTGYAPYSRIDISKRPTD